MTSELLQINMPRVVVDEFKPEDLGTLNQIFGHMYERGQPWFNVDPNDPETVSSFLQLALDNQKQSPRENYRMAIRFREPDGDLRLIGYVSLCKIFNQEEGFPDTGVFIDPSFQMGGYAREARIGIMMFAFCLAHIGTLYCDIAKNNQASQTNVLGMGYQQHHDLDGNPVEILTKTVEGRERWYRFSLRKDDFESRLQGLIGKLSPRWDHVPPKILEDFRHTAAGLGFPIQIATNGAHKPESYTH